MWLETALTSLDLISVVSSFADSEIRNLDFFVDSVNVGDNTQEVELSVHQGAVRVTSAFLALKQAPTMDIMVPVLQYAAVLTCVSAPPLGPTLSAPLLVQKTSLAAPLLVPGPVLQGNRAPMTMQGPAFPPISSAQIMFSGAPVPMQSTGAPLQSAAIPPISGAP